ncbi:MAG TPA: methyltransferase [Vicinamibacterales bacterium]|nr:methyltransferase [Vicinamibacterales bacterium]
MPQPKPYLSIVRYCEALLEQHGDSHLGVGWRTQEIANTGFRVMLDLIRTPDAKVSLLDFGCGLSHLYEYIRARGFDHITYAGLDLSPRFLEVSRRKFPEITYYDFDVLEEPDRLPVFDYIIIHGLFTARIDIPYPDMFDYVSSVLRVLFPKARTGLAFTMMSKYVDWERDDLFHVPFDELARFLTQHLTRNFVIRHDYGLYEYTTYLYKDARFS